MFSSGSCARCRREAALLPPGGLCRECSSTGGGGLPTPRLPLPNHFPRGAPPDAPHSFPVAPAADPSARTVIDPLGAGAPDGSFGVAADGGGASRAPALPPAPPGYEVLERLGGGGMGEVFLARELASRRPVAMKFLRRPGDAVALDRFVRELQALAELDHPRIVRLFAHDFLCAAPFFTMEYLEGGPLPHKPDDPPLEPAEAVRVVRLVGGALAAAHARGVVHRDVKPSNVLLTADRVPKVADFGLAKLLDDADPLTTSGGGLGTPSYMPPEQVSKRYGAVGPWSDVYALGATLYHLLAGRPPFVGDTPYETVRQVLAAPPPLPRRLRPDVPAGLEGVVLKCLEKAPADRYQSMAELVADLDRYEQKRRTVAPQHTPRERLRRWARRNRRGLAAAVTAAALAVGAAAAGRALAPLPPVRAPAPPVEPLRAIRDELAADRRAVLVGAAGRPRHSRWLIGAAAVIEPTAAAPAFAFETTQPTALELLPDPGAARYRLTAEVRLLYTKTVVRKIDGQEGGAGDAALIGLSVGGTSLSTVKGEPVCVFLAVSYSDFRSLVVPAAPETNRGAVQPRAVAIVAPDGEFPRGTKTSAGKPIQFDLADDLPGPWRRLRIEATPDGVTAFWAASPTAEWQSLGALSAEKIAERLTKVETALGVALAPHPPLRWNPAAAVGLWCDQAAMSARNVVLEVLP